MMQLAIAELGLAPSSAYAHLPNAQLAGQIVGFEPCVLHSKYQNPLRESRLSFH